MRQVILILGFTVLISNMVYSQNSLDEFISTSLHNSPVILAQKNNRRLSSLDSAILRSSLKTQVTSQNEGFYYPIVNGIGYDEVITNGQQIGVMINFDKEVLFKGQFKANLNSSVINNEIAENDFKISEKTLIKTITDLYLTSYGNYLQWEYNKEILDLFVQEDSILQSLTHSNIYKQSDYLVFLTELNRQHLAVNNAKLQYKTSLIDLRYEAGIMDTTLVYLQPPDLKIKELPVRQNSIYFNQYSLDSLQLLNDISLISASYKPHLQLHADAGYLSSLAYNPYKNFGVGIGMSLLIPIYDGGARTYKIDKVRVQQDNLLSGQTFFGKQYDLQSKQLFSYMNDLNIQNKEIESQLKFYDQLLEAEKKLISIGQLDILQYFVVIQNFIDMKNQETINRIRIYMLINQLNYLAN